MNEPMAIFESAPLVLASRASQLAMAQARLVQSELAPVTTDILSLTTKGDRVLDRSLADAGGKGLFIKELERAMLAGECDAAIHSMKDMETHFADGTEIAAVLPREDRRDALIGGFENLAALPAGAVVGTASVRRKALLLHHRPDVTVKLLRGNVNRRLAALDAGEYDAIILAVAGLKRLRLDVAYSPLDEDIMPTAAAQGALAVQVRCPDSDRSAAVKDACAALNCSKAEAEVNAERALLGFLDGSCHTPIAASAHLDDHGTLRLTGMVLNLDGSQSFKDEVTGPAATASDLGCALGDALLSAAGGRSFLA